MTARPEYVDIGPHRYAIRWDEAALDRERVRQDESTMHGAIRYQQNEITVDSKIVGSHQRRALLHEILHGVLEVTGWAGPGPEKPDADDFLVRLDSMLLDVIQRNPHVVQWLCTTEDREAKA